MSKKRIAVCGYNSSVGAWVVNRYSDEYDFVLLGRRNPDIYVDLKKQQLSGPVDLLNGCQAIVNFSAATDSRDFSQINTMLQTNILGPVFLAEIARQRGIPHMVHISSISATYSEGDVYYGYYAQSKQSGDAVLKRFCRENGIACCILRPSALFGQENYGRHQKLLFNIMERASKGETITLYGNRDSCRNYIHISTLANVIHRVIETQTTGVYNVVNAKNDSLTQIADALNEYYGKGSKVVFLPDRPDVEELRLSDSGEIYGLLSIEPPAGFKGELEKEYRL